MTIWQSLNPRVKGLFFNCLNVNNSDDVIGLNPRVKGLFFNRNGLRNLLIINCLNPRVKGLFFNVYRVVEKPVTTS